MLTEYREHGTQAQVVMLDASMSFTDYPGFTD